jgi:hypothetical protein
MRSSSRESAALLNPAFMALLTHRSVSEYVKSSGLAMPFLLPYLCVPASLHPEVRNRLTYNKTTNLISWVEENADLRIAIRQASIGLKPYVAEGLSFGLIYRTLQVSQGALEPGPIVPIKSLTTSLTSEVRACQRAAAYMGRWFAASGSVSQICTALGVRP